MPIEICQHVAVKVWQRALGIMLGVHHFVIHLYCQTTLCRKPTSLRCHLMAKCCLKVGRNRNLRQEICQHGGCKSMTEGPTIMLGVFITLLYTYTMPNNHYCSKPTSLRCHLMAKCCLKVGKNRDLRQETCQHGGCKSMTEGPTIMLGVFITLLYTYTMPNNLLL